MGINLLTNVTEKLASVDFILGSILIVIAYIISFLIFKRLLVRIANSVMCLVLIIFIAFSLNVSSIVLAVAIVILNVIVGFINAGSFRNSIANPSKTVKTLKWFGGNKSVDEEVMDQEQVLKIICDATATLSKSKTGALITFERKDSLEDYIKTGSIINAPITKEIIQTIFYPGTRLHDGAIVIKNNLIVSASVYYTPTTKPLSGKYGARHRAAMGICEITDAITIVVSEETGRISIAVNGELIPVSIDNVYRVLEEYFDNKE